MNQTHFVALWEEFDAWEVGNSSVEPAFSSNLFRFQAVPFDISFIPNSCAFLTTLSSGASYVLLGTSRLVNQTRFVALRKQFDA